jgi:hypothetical protein
MQNCLLDRRKQNEVKFQVDRKRPGGNKRTLGNFQPDFVNKTGDF